MQMFQTFVNVYQHKQRETLLQSLRYILLDVCIGWQMGLLSKVTERAKAKFQSLEVLAICQDLEMWARNYLETTNLSFKKFYLVPK